MRCSIFLLAALAVKASADVAAVVSSAPKVTAALQKKKGTTEESAAAQAAAFAASQAAAVAPPRQAGVSFGIPPAVDPLSGTTAAPWKRIVPPVVAAAALAAGVGGLIALSVNKLPTTTPGPQAVAKAKEVAVAKMKEVATTLAPVTTTVNGTATGDAVSSGMQQNTVLAVACGLVVCGMLAICIVCVMQLCCNKKKRTRKLPPARETPMPEDQMPMMASQMESARGPAQDLNESQYMPVNVPPLVPGQGYAGGVGLGSIPTMANVVPMQTMPPPPPQYQQAGTSVYQSAAPVGSYMQQRSYISQNAGASIYQQASPLANTVSALPTMNNMPTTAFNMQAPPTTYFN